MKGMTRAALRARRTEAHAAVERLKVRRLTATETAQAQIDRTVASLEAEVANIDRRLANRAAAQIAAFGKDRIEAAP